MSKQKKKSKSIDPAIQKMIDTAEKAAEGTDDDKLDDDYDERDYDRDYSRYPQLTKDEIRFFNERLGKSGALITTVECPMCDDEKCLVQVDVRGNGYVLMQASRCKGVTI